MEDYDFYCDLSTKLKLISSIKPQHKLNTHSLEISYDNTSTKLQRTYQCLFGNKGATRHDLYCFIKNVVDQSFNFILKYKNDLNEVNIKYCDALKNAIMDVKVNMKTNIRETYLSDHTFTIKLVEFADQIELRIRTLDSKDIKDSILSPTSYLISQSN